MAIDFGAAVPSAVVGGAVAAAVGYWRDQVTRADREARFDEQIKALKEQIKAGEEKAEDDDGTLKEQLRDLRGDFKDAIAEMKAVAMTVAKSEGTRDAFMAMTTKAIEAVITTQEKHSGLIAEHTAQLRNVAEYIERAPCDPNKGCWNQGK